MIKNKILTAIVAGLLLTGAAQAAAITIATPGGSQVGGQNVSASADFVTSAGSLTITLRNLITNSNGVIQNVSGLDFVLSSGQTSGTLTSSSGIFRTVADDGSFTDTGPGTTDWSLTGLYLNALNDGPDQTIVGAPGAAKYAVNGSIAGNDPHNPFLFGDVTFNIAIAGLTAQSTVTSAGFWFGTVPERLTTTNKVPDGGATVVLLGLGLVGMSFLARRKIA